MTDGERLCLTAALVALVAVVAWQAFAAAACIAARVWPRRKTWARLAARAPGRARRLAAYVCGVLLAGTPAVAHADSSTPDEPVVRAPASVTAPAPAPVAEPAVAQPVTAAPIGAPVSTQHLVVTGDNLWRIASAELERRTGLRPDDDAIARYSRAVVDANRATLRSGDPSLVYPGELVILPG